MLLVLERFEPNQTKFDRHQIKFELNNPSFERALGAFEPDIIDVVRFKSSFMLGNFFVERHKLSLMRHKSSLMRHKPSLSPVKLSFMRDKPSLSPVKLPFMRDKLFIERQKRAFMRTTTSPVRDRPSSDAIKPSVVRDRLCLVLNKPPAVDNNPSVDDNNPLPVPIKPPGRSPRRLVSHTTNTGYGRTSSLPRPRQDLLSTGWSQGTKKRFVPGSNLPARLARQLVKRSSHSDLHLGRDLAARLGMTEGERLLQGVAGAAAPTAACDVTLHRGALLRADLIL
jgi:hypothetical protein